MLRSVRDRGAALVEIFRVVRPGGRLHVLEHVCAEEALLRGVRKVLNTTVWPLAIGG